MIGAGDQDHDGESSPTSSWPRPMATGRAIYAEYATSHRCPSPEYTELTGNGRLARPGRGRQLPAARQ